MNKIHLVQLAIFEQTCRMTHLTTGWQSSRLLLDMLDVCVQPGTVVCPLCRYKSCRRQSELPEMFVNITYMTKSAAWRTRMCKFSQKAPAPAFSTIFFELHQMILLFDKVVKSMCLHKLHVSIVFHFAL